MGQGIYIGKVARAAVPWLFAFPVVLLGYAHYRVWFLRQGHWTAKIILIPNTVLVVWLWYDRVKVWLLR